MYVVKRIREVRAKRRLACTPTCDAAAASVISPTYKLLIEKAPGLLKTMPWTGALFAFGLMTLIGLPPGGIFIAEFALFRAGFALKHPWLMGAALALLAVVFVSFIRHLNKMLYGTPSAEEINTERPTERFSWRIALLLINVAMLITLGLSLPAPLETLLNQSVGIISK